MLAGAIRRSFADVARRFDLNRENCPKHPSNCETAWVASAMDKGVFYFMMEADGRPCGCVALEPTEEGVCYLERLAVLPEFRGAGRGRALVEHVIQEARSLGAERVEIGIIAAQAELQAWYEKLGFIVSGRRRFDHLPFEVTFMVRSLAV